MNHEHPDLQSHHICIFVRPVLVCPETSHLRSEENVINNVGWVISLARFYNSISKSVEKTQVIIQTTTL